ncbi:perlucin-like protein [Myxocyprinus asiaticus]|uniref:perlucin-like protein n=1 Tax=Myxocyprinus asiaticus TaxID=70543 RepID=UPI0022226654|nr:perlucin-like protein [Myxocyprinus asiaticus]XP_051569910.1 perlucin-like protein [Myxocyprinus asiaticus]
MAENIYLNWVSDSELRPDSKHKDGGQCSKPMQMLFTVLLFLSLLANGGLAYLYHNKYANWHCEPIRNCLNSDFHLDVQPIISLKNYSPPNYCSEKWFKAKGRLYVFSTDTKDWKSSRKRCQALGGDLVIINSGEEQDFLSKNVNGYYDFHWIGLTDSQTEGVWHWVDNASLTSYIAWESPPDDWKVENPVGEDCVILKHDKWGDVSCLRQEKRICEIPCSPP